MLNNATAFYKRASCGGFLCRVFSGVLHSLSQRVLHSYLLITSRQEALVVTSGGALEPASQGGQVCPDQVCPDRVCPDRVCPRLSTWPV